MKRLLLLVVALSISIFLTGQQIELGLDFGYSWDNLVDLDINEGKATIGDRLWKSYLGMNGIYYFDEPITNRTFAVGFKYQFKKRGSVSEQFSDSRFEISSNLIGIFGRYSNNFIPGIIAVYMDVGLGYVFLSNSKYYYGYHSQSEAFQILEDDLTLRNGLVTFIYAIGIEGEIKKDKLKIFFELNGDAGISRINESPGKFGTQPLGYGIGIKYILKLAKNTGLNHPDMRHF